MIFMTVRDDDSFDTVCFILEVIEIGDDVINADHVVIGEHHASIDDKNILTVFINGHILTHFSQSSQGDNS